MIGIARTIVTRSTSRLAGFTLTAVLTLSLAVASTAFAEPEFKPTGTTFAGTSGSNVLTAGADSITCTANTISGTISSATLAGGITVDFTGCKSTSDGGAESCTVKSAGGNAGLIITNTLHGVLGLILPKGAGSGVGLLLLPVANKKWDTLASTKCTVESTVNGTLAGEVSPIGSKRTTAKLVFAKGTSGESIKDIDLSTGGSVVPELEAFGHEASEEATESLTFCAEVEVS
jgi:hypothetical protein